MRIGSRPDQPDSSSAAVDNDIANIGAYSAARSAIDSFTRATAVAWAAHGIRVNSIMPIALTPAVQASLDHMPGFEEQLIATIPLGRLGDPESDIGPAVAFLCSPAAHFITGTTLSVGRGHGSPQITRIRVARQPPRLGDLSAEGVVGEYRVSPEPVVRIS